MPGYLSASTITTTLTTITTTSTTFLSTSELRNDATDKLLDVSKGRASLPSPVTFPSVTASALHFPDSLTALLWHLFALLSGLRATFLLIHSGALLLHPCLSHSCALLLVGGGAFLFSSSGTFLLSNSGTLLFVDSLAFLLIYSVAFPLLHSIALLSGCS